ncbi:cbb3-type cytochrome c oxidase subunit 3 [Rhodobacter sp. KR11]|uniref:cbb3-type cytochrome c oxidase subunit 3 n=1 Tax=Rhodobacter sp. KR11 TaxID=2974588 RepID=UPI00222365E0|nr:cbb3-type cytochrome c oxidase subunit 3 [Rhodobacter sp. KR11]MCW1919113.1 cbb3-type cytochrome c oxidase subunit 3 [Rhodobacter sp. KR11]
MTYDLLAEFARSWAVVGLMAFFVAMVLWIFRPGSGKLHQEAATMIFRHDKNPGPVPGQSKEV